MSSEFGLRSLRFRAVKLESELWNFVGFSLGLRFLVGLSGLVFVSSCWV